METIDIKELLKYFEEKLFVIVIPVIALLLLGCVYTLFIKVPKYESSSYIILIGNNSEELNTSNVSLNQSLVSTYSKIVKSKRVLKEVIDKLNLEYKYEELTKMIAVNSVDDTELIEIKVTSLNNKLSSDIANEISNEFVVQIKDLYNMSNVEVLDKAEVSKEPCNINTLKEIVVFIGVGLIIGLGIVFIMFYFDRTIKTTDQIEKIGLPILGTVEEKK